MSTSIRTAARRRWRSAAGAMIAIGLSGLASAGQAPQAAAPAPAALTLEQAEATALRNSPRLGALQLRTLAENQTVTEQRSAYFPTLYGNVTDTLADHGTLIGAGALSTATLNTRSAAGLSLGQLVTDFGRTSSLVQSARLQAAADSSLTTNMRAQVLLAVRQAYYQVVAAAAVRQATQAALDNRQLTLRQITALAASQLKSTLDVQFAQVLVSEAELANVQADDEWQESWAGLAAAMGEEQTQIYSLGPVPLPTPLAPDPTPLITQALAQRSDLKALELNVGAAHQQAEADKKLAYPTLSLVAAAGTIPDHDSVVHKDEYAAAGVNLSIPVFNGGLFAARHAESQLRAQAGDKDVEDLRVRIARDIRDAWLEASTAFRDLEVTDRLVQESDRALELAQARYDNGLGSIVELNQAQLSQTSAQIQSASARSIYLSRRATLDFVAGLLH